MPMDYAGADLQGAIGYMFVKAFRNEFRRRGIEREPVAVVTRNAGRPRRPRVQGPDQADRLAYGRGEGQGAGRRAGLDRQGRRRPRLAARGAVADPAGDRRLRGDRALGRAPAMWSSAAAAAAFRSSRTTQGDLQGVEAVIDKDLASSLLARAIGADLFLLSTGRRARRDRLQHSRRNAGSIE